MALNNMRMGMSTWASSCLADCTVKVRWSIKRSLAQSFNTAMMAIITLVKEMEQPRFSTPMVIFTQENACLARDMVRER